MQAPVPDELFVWHREIPSEWTAKLHQQLPPSERVSWLEFVWEPGTPFEPIQRWTLYQMWPPYLLRLEKNRVLLQELEGPSPETLTLVDQHGMAVRRPTITTRRQWDLFRRTGTIGWWWWTIQGAHGGTRYALSALEQRILTMLGVPTEPPAPGSLPYADFDGRVQEQIAAQDLLQQMGGRVDAFLGGGRDQLAVHQAQAYRRKLVAWWREQMQEPADLLAKAQRDGELDHTPVRNVDPEATLARDELYIAAGNSLSD